MKVFKSGCFLIDKENYCVALIYRQKQKDYTFPKGHVESDEDIKTAAIREVAEEVKRKAEIIDKIEPYIDEYISSTGEDCICYMYFAIDKGVSDNKSLDEHELIWIKIDEVEEKLTYPSLKAMWNKVKFQVKNIINLK